MKIISGIRRGMSLQTMEGTDTRPTLGKVREAIFSSIQFNIEGRKALDLFAGSGAMGIEILSRGAESCDFVDNNKLAVEIINKNLIKTKFNEKVFLKDSIEFLKLTDEKYHIIFIDPPYNKGLTQKSLDIILQKQLLCENGFVICEILGVEKLNTIGYNIIREKNYGKTKVIILKVDTI